MTRNSAHRPRSAEPGRPGFFVLCSLGQAGSRWLGKSLSLHPDIWCLVGRQEPEGCADHENDVELSTRRLNDRMARVRATPFQGYVHRHTVFDVARIENEDASTACRNVIRHPVARINSAFHTFARNLEVPYVDLYLRNTRAKFADKIDDLGRRLAIDITDGPTLCFVCSALYLFVFTKEIIHARDTLGKPGDFHIIMEKMVGDRDYFAAMVATLTGGRIAAEDAYLDQVFAGANTPAADPDLSSQENSNGLAAAEAWQGWQGWQRAVVADLIDEFDAAALFAPFGYKLPH